MTSLRERLILHRSRNRDNLTDGPPAEDYDDRRVPTVILTISREVSSPGAVNRRIEASAQENGACRKSEPRTIKSRAFAIRGVLSLLGISRPDGLGFLRLDRDAFQEESRWVVFGIRIDGHHDLVVSLEIAAQHRLG